MSEITEIFVLKLKDPQRAEAVRERARADFLSLDGVSSWKTYVTTDPKRPTLFAEVYRYPDLETAQRVTPQFAKREPSQAFLAEIDEVVVGQTFTEQQPKEVR